MQTISFRKFKKNNIKTQTGKVKFLKATQLDNDRWDFCELVTSVFPGPFMTSLGKEGDGTEDRYVGPKAEGQNRDPGWCRSKKEVQR